MGSGVRERAPLALAVDVRDGAAVPVAGGAAGASTETDGSALGVTVSLAGALKVPPWYSMPQFAASTRAPPAEKVPDTEGMGVEDSRALGAPLRVKPLRVDLGEGAAVDVAQLRVEEGDTSGEAEARLRDADADGVDDEEGRGEGVGTLARGEKEEDRVPEAVAVDEPLEEALERALEVPVACKAPAPGSKAAIKAERGRSNVKCNSGMPHCVHNTSRSSVLERPLTGWLASGAAAVPGAMTCPAAETIAQ